MRTSWLLALVLALAGPAAAQTRTPTGALLYDVLPYQPTEVQIRAYAALERSGDRGAIPALVELLRFDLAVPVQLPVALLERLSGQSFGAAWPRWVEWLQRQPDITPPPEFVAWKGRLLSLIDPAFLDWFTPGVPHRIRMEEIVWGGVAKDGIPALTNAAQVPVAGAPYLTDDELVFGVSLNGDTRAYPHRIMDWHELANDVVGGVPVALAYCTLCGSGTLFEATAQGRTYTFGSSGLLFRSNKLMYDHETTTLWNHMTGEPVVGPLAGSGIRLKVLPVVITTWREWRTAHPGTRVLDIHTGYTRDYTPGRPYGRYFASPDTMFPVSPRSDRLWAKDFVFAVRLDAAAKVFPLEAFRREPVVNDRVGATPVVVLGKPETRTVRAYERDGLSFRAGAGSDELTEAATGARWRVEEDRLVEPATGRTLARVGGHVVYWFGWYAFYPEAEVYTPPASPQP